MLARAQYWDTTVFQSEGGLIKKQDKAAVAMAIKNGGFWGPWQPDGPLPTPPTPAAPTPAAPTPPTPPTPSPAGFTLVWTGSDGTNAAAAAADDAGSCLVVDSLQKGGEAKLGACGGKGGEWQADGKGRLSPVGATDPVKRFLRQNVQQNCSLGNYLSLGTDAKGSIYTAFDAASNRLFLSACGGYCVGGGAGSVADGRLTIVECSDQARAQHWAKK